MGDPWLTKRDWWCVNSCAEKTALGSVTHRWKSQIAERFSNRWTKHSLTFDREGPTLVEPVVTEPEANFVTCLEPWLWDDGVVLVAVRSGRYG